MFLNHCFSQLLFSNYVVFINLFMCIIIGRTTKVTDNFMNVLHSYYHIKAEADSCWLIFWFRAGAGFTHSSLIIFLIVYIDYNVTSFNILWGIGKWLVRERINWSCGVYCGTTNITFTVETLSVNVHLLKRSN